MRPIKYVRGDIVRNPWTTFAKYYIYIKRGKRYVHMLRLYKGLFEEANFYKEDFDKAFYKVGHSDGFDRMVAEANHDWEPKEAHEIVPFEEVPVRTAVVKFDPDICFFSNVGVYEFGNFAYKETEKYLTVLGNVFENPELLEVRDE